MEVNYFNPPPPPDPPFPLPHQPPSSSSSSSSLSLLPFLFPVFKSNRLDQLESVQGRWYSHPDSGWFRKDFNHSPHPAPSPLTRRPRPDLILSLLGNEFQMQRTKGPFRTSPIKKKMNPVIPIWDRSWRIQLENPRSNPKGKKEQKRVANNRQPRQRILRWISE